MYTYPLVNINSGMWNVYIMSWNATYHAGELSGT